MSGLRAATRVWAGLALLAVLALGACAPASEEAVEPQVADAEIQSKALNAESSETPHRLDCAGDPRALLDAEPVVQHRDGAELHQYWLLEDRPDLWAPATPSLEPLHRYREAVRKVLPDTSPLGMIGANRERNPWLGREYPNEDKVNRQVEAGVGRHRPMNCLESHVLAFQAARFPLYEHPTEIVALFVKGILPSGNAVKVYIAADDDTVLPKPNPAVEAIEADVANGWTFHAAFHNHTFDHTPDRGLIPVASPSTSDLQVSVALAERLGLEGILVTDGFSTLELTADEVEGLWRSVDVE